MTSMGNKSKINGDSNVVVQGSSNTNVNSRSNSKTPNDFNYQRWGIILTIISIVIAIIVGWDNIAEFLGL